MQQVDEAAIIDRAHAAADAAGAGAGVSVRALTELDDLERLAALLDEVWGTKVRMISTELLKALSHSGNYVVGARAGDELIGGGVAIVGMDGGEVILHSHIVGVSSKAQGRNAGFAIKQHQRAWALERGITSVHWTFDPLVRRNAYFNITKLGARAAAYYPNFYGSMADGLNAGDETDRMLVCWDLLDPAAVEASEGRHPDPDVGALEGSMILTPDGSPTGVRSDVVLCATPADIVLLREDDLELARTWRRNLRITLTEALADGYAVTGFSRSGCYILTRR